MSGTSSIGFLLASTFPSLENWASAAATQPADISGSDSFSAAVDYATGGMSALTLLAAGLGSPALARICAHPVFAGVGLFLGVRHQILALGHVDGFLSGATLFLASVGSAVTAYSFYRGARAGLEALFASTRIAAFDRAQQLQEEALSSLEGMIAKDPKNASALKETKDRLEVALKATVTASENWKDLRDEKPQRIEAAKQSSLVAQETIPGLNHRRIREKIEEAQRQARDTSFRASTAGRETPVALSRAAGAGDDTSLVLGKLIEAEDVLDAASKSDPLRIFWSLRYSKNHRDYVQKTASHAFEANRVAYASPDNWIGEARGDARFSPMEKALQAWLGKAAGSSLLTLVPIFAVLQAVFGNGPLLPALISAALGCAPAATVYLYNARRGSRRFKVSPAVNQELSLERYGEPELQVRTAERLHRAIPPLAPGERKKFQEATAKSMDRVKTDLDQLERAEVVFPQAPVCRSGGVPQSLFDKTPAGERRQPRDDRKFRYDGGSSKKDAKARRRLREEIKAMSLEQLEAAIRRGDVTHVDVFNMIADHRIARDGAVLPRPLEGRLRKRLLRMASKADRLGLFRPFLLVKDLFPGIDGEVTAGSKTANIGDLPKSPLVERLIQLGFIPIPCGLTAGANGGSGLYNGHGTVGNPTVPLHDTAGSSSAEAYALGLKDFPVRLAIGTDTGGSISAPCGATKLYGWVAEKGMLSRINMIPFATHLDTPGVMGVDRREVLRLARRLTLPVYQNRFEQPVRQPVIAYFETDLALASQESRANFERMMESMRGQGFPVVKLGKNLSAFRQIPLDLYQDSYVGAGFSLMNPLEENRWGEPERYQLDRNLETRLGKGLALMEAPDGRHGNLFNRNLDLHVRFKDLFQRKFPAGVVFAAPAPEPVPLDDFKPQGLAGTKLDSHDILGGMLKNRVDNALFVDPQLRLVLEGRTTDLMAILG